MKWLMLWITVVAVVDALGDYRFSPGRALATAMLAVLLAALPYDPAVLVWWLVMD